MKEVKIEALVIKKEPVLKNDLVITLFARDLGKIKVFAKGIKKIISRRLSHTDTGNFVKALLYNKKGSYYLKQSSLISAFIKIKNNPHKVKYLFFILFLLDRFLPENQEENKIFFLTLDYLSGLARGKADSNELLRYSNQLFIFLGYGKKIINFDSLRRFVEKTLGETVPLIM